MRNRLQEKANQGTRRMRTERAQINKRKSRAGKRANNKPLL